MVISGPIASIMTHTVWVILYKKENFPAIQNKIILEADEQFHNLEALITKHIVEHKSSTNLEFLHIHPVCYKRYKFYFEGYLLYFSVKFFRPSN